ncbi:MULTISPECIES: hypothetical protein [unclassified Rhodococcus (in: high G+C Gram-positive bacteria)]|uniref:lipase/acyltransferase domain-containing protein n=1 Tax=unclassified Rhodococcus (in: high G+C Gram-positive bacteria) TaxID=192944 RepID=UPI0007D95587|nr:MULTISPECIES: hypothetical protein [unclassified Rhodococcus (in: high G+C Gram-positive bacteria)]WML60969.1 hypothetical protein QNA09_00250 [Rhodococcus sp. AH-ZY2]
MSTKLILLIPGIGGSTLCDTYGDPVWGYHVRGSASTILRRPERLAIDQPLRPSGLLKTMAVLPWKKVAGYESLERTIRSLYRLRDDEVDVSLETRPPNLSARLVSFPYDFRLPAQEVAQRLLWDVERRLEALGPDTKVIAIAHSLGGLVARWWWAMGGHAVCERLITIGTPHRGAPKAVDWLVNGVRFGGGPASAVTGHVFGEATEVLRSWPSTYELLPRYRAVFERDQPRYPHELAVATADFRNRASSAYASHLELETICTRLHELPPAQRPTQVSFYSQGHPTPARAVVTESGLQISKTDAEWLPNVGWLGDGTVPAISAIPIEHSTGPDVDQFRRFAPESHIPLQSGQTVAAYLASLNSASLASVRDVGATAPWIGFDVDDVYPVGQLSVLSVRLNGADRTDAGARISVRGPGDMDFGDAVAMEPDEDGWSVRVAPPEEGCYSVKVQVDYGRNRQIITAYDSYGAYAV